MLIIMHNVVLLCMSFKDEITNDDVKEFSRFWIIHKRLTVKKV